MFALFIFKLNGDDNMLTIKNGDKEIELKFGLGQLNAIDKELGLEIQEVSLGEGLEMLIPKLKSGNIIGIAKMIKAITRTDKNRPKNEEELELVLESIIEEHGSLKTFGQLVIDELGNRLLTQGLVAE